MDYEHYILQGEAKSTEFSDDRSYLMVQKANSYCACVGRTEECCLQKIVLTYDFGLLLYTCLDRCAAGVKSQTHLGYYGGTMSGARDLRDKNSR